jgi:hypothetical protein
MKVTDASGGIRSDVARLARDTLGRSRRLIDLQHTYRKKLQAPRGSTLPVNLAERLFTTPAMTAPLATQILNVTPRAAQLTSDKLVAAGILHLSPGLSHPRVYVCDEIIEVIQADRL